MIRPGLTPPRLETPTVFGATPERAERSLRELDVANRFCRGSASLLAHVREEADRMPFGGVLCILDVASGAGDIPRALVRWTRRRDIRARVVALDRHPAAVRAAARACSRAYPEIRCVQGDVYALPFGRGSFDLVLCSMALHYFTSDNVVWVLTRLAELAERAVIVADVERHWIPYAAVEQLARLTRGRLVRRGLNDTVLRGFTPGELEVLAERARLAEWRVHRHFPYRLVLVGCK